MTKNERTALQGFMNKLAEVNRAKDECFDKLKDMNKRVGSHKAWCSAEDNYSDIMKYSYDMYKEEATSIYAEYKKLCGKYEMLDEYGTMLAELNFWK